VAGRFPLTFNVFGLKISNARKEVFSETKEQLNLSNIFEKVIHRCISKEEDKKKELVPKFFEKQLPDKEPSTSGTKDEYRVQQKVIIVKDEKLRL